MGKSLSQHNVQETLIDGFLQRMMELRDGGINYLLDVIDSTEDLISTDSKDQSKPVNKNSPIGLFIRQTVVHVKKLSLYHVTQLYTATVQFIKGLDHVEEEEEEEQTMQASQIITPLERHRKATHLTNSVDWMLSENYPSALDELLRYFDYTMRPVDRKSSHQSLGIHHAAIGLTMVHHYFGHKDQALMALHESIRLSQAASDADCLEHALSWLHAFTLSGAPNSQALIETLQQRAQQAKHTGMEVLARLRYLRSILKCSNRPPTWVLVGFESNSAADYNVIGVKVSSNGHLLQSALWKRAGQRILSSLHDQQLLRGFDPDQPLLPIGIKIKTATEMAWEEIFCIAIANQSAALADQVSYPNLYL